MKQIDGMSKYLIKRLRRVLVLGSALLAISHQSAHAQQCANPLTDEIIKPLSDQLCAETYAEIDVARGTFNLGGDGLDIKMKRLVAILNTFDSNRTLSASDREKLLNDVGKIVVLDRPAVRHSLKKNLIISLLQQEEVMRWCRWKKRGGTPERTQDNQKIVEKVEGVMRCGLE